MPNSPTIAVVIPTYNRAKLVHQAIDSALAQRYPAAEIIVVDDGSKDDTVAALALYGNRIKAIHQANMGLSGARNTGILAATSDWIAFLDDDDEFTPDRLLIASESMRLHPDAVVHMTNTAIVSEDGTEADLFKIRGLRAQENMRLERPLVWGLRGGSFSQSLIVRRDVLIAAGLYRKTFYEDMDLFIRLAFRGPWTVDSRRSLRLIRRPGDDLNLSTQWRSKPIENYEALVRIHREALSAGELNQEEQLVTLTGLSTNLFELGQSYHLSGRKKQAFECFKECTRISPRLQSRFKARLPMMLGTFGIKLIERFGSRRKAVMRSTVPKPKSA